MKLYWQDRGARLVWRWILFVYALLALALALIGSLSIKSDLVLAALFLAATLLVFLGRELNRIRVWQAAVILLLPVLPYGLLYGAGYVDITAGRSLYDLRILGVPIVTKVSEGDVTPHYRQYINPKLPKATWRLGFSTSLGSLGPIHTDYFVQGVGSAGSILASLLEEYDPPSEVKSRLVRGFFSLVERHKYLGEVAVSGLASRYTFTVKHLFEDNMGIVQPSDLPDPDEFARKWLEEHPEWSDEQ